MESHIVKNLKSLTREKALIAAGQKEIADMTEDLKAKLEHTAGAMERQGEMQGDTHEEILKDLATIREQVRRSAKMWAMLTIDFRLRHGFCPRFRREK